MFLWFFLQGGALTDINLDQNDILLGNKDQDMDVSMTKYRSFKNAVASRIQDGVLSSYYANNFLL